MAAITAQQAGSANRIAFLDLLAFSEGTSSEELTQNDGYDVIVTGVDGGEVFTDYSDHPFAHRAAKVIRKGPPVLVSTASGRYQLLYRFWTSYKASLKLADFSPLSQDLVALQQIRERNALTMIDAGDFDLAISQCSSIWASLPGNSYGQGGKPMGVLLAKVLELQSA
ncbi:glycoside hydrolase family protein [Granulicella sp. 5B5]|uniref:glycoside hydrolase family 24 protein n=1 Tax=Granulicella sp. 5B5 TaxID=1617967 RepID=UPI0015F56C91|nr:glycoside hydrolase family 104 protein [Granulicella sp. 5B5]QMV19678.1 glycoside hydrolase family protein [Granulicella sp. 5B5]